mmetsp:Transcript_42520/g.66615  ORF Transcript_42520/g.66615 Transcript_42520/m.66615 type:complete len:325 (-) Transcript_42520:166-1140(-)
MPPYQWYLGGSNRGPTVRQMLRSLRSQSQGGDAVYMAETENMDPMEGAVAVATHHLTVPDAISLLRGDAAPLQALQVPLREYFTTNLLEGELSDANLERSSGRLAESVIGDANVHGLESGLLELVGNPDEINGVINSTLRHHMRLLLRLILSSPVLPSPSNPHPFASDLKHWFCDMIGDLQRHLDAEVENGRPDAERVAKGLVMQRFRHLSAEADYVIPLGESILFDQIWREAVNFYEQGPAEEGASAEWAQLLDWSERREWVRIVTEDRSSQGLQVQAQEGEDRQFSEAYLSAVHPSRLYLYQAKGAGSGNVNGAAGPEAHGS